MDTVSPADLAEVEKMIEAGVLDPSATRSALELMAGRYLAEEVRKRRRRAARRDERATRPWEPSAARIAQVLRITERVAEKARTEWADLLDATFALPSGERVTWRDATVAQHEERARMLEVMAAGDIETAALHREAIHDIRALSRRTLGELP